MSLVERVIIETGMEPVDLELEVTDGVIQTDRQNLLVFKALKGLGVQLAIDDFGIGYSSFASLKHLSVDCLKIDRYFVDDMIKDEQTLLLVESMVEMGHHLGCGIVAEGIELSEQLELIRRFGCETAQGYLFSRPLRADQVSPLLTRRFAA